MYWQGDSRWMACGTGAASYTHDRRFTRPKSVTKYFEYVDALAQFDIMNEPVETSEQIVNTIAMCKLRTIDGLKYSDLSPYLTFSQITEFKD